MHEDTPPSLQLIETMLYRHRIRFLDAHMQRLQRAADAFSIPLPAQTIYGELRTIHTRIRTPEKHKVRLTVDLAGNYRITTKALTSVPHTFRRVCFSPYRVDSSNIFFYHKTTERHLYESEYARAAAAGYHEILFLNEKDELTEGSRSNLFLRLEDGYCTPRIPAGLLPGIYRQQVLHRCPGIQEKDITLDDVRRATRLYVCNAVTGLQSVHLVDTFLTTALHDEAPHSPNDP